MHFHIEFELCALLFLLVPILAFKKDKKKKIYSAQYISFLIMSILCGLIEISTALMLDNNKKNYSDLTLAFAYAASLSILTIISSVIIFFIHGRLFFARKKGATKYYFINVLPSCIAIVIILFSPFTHIAFNIKNGILTNTIFILIIPLEIIVYLIWAYAFLIQNRKFADKESVLTVTYLGICFLAPWVIALFAPEYLTFLTFLAISAFIIYQSYESNSEYVDTITGALNREAFSNRFTGNYEKSENIFVIAMDNFKIVNELYGIDGGNFLMHEMVTDLQEEFGKKSVYRFNGDIFTLILSDLDTETTKNLNTIQRIIARPHRFSNKEVRLSACIGLVHSKNHDGNGIMTSIEYSVQRAKSIGKSQFYEVREEAIEAIERKKAIERAIMENINKETFEVHYQPIYDTHKKRFHSMEALARLNVPNYGYVSPEEFIKIAEKNGTVIQIGILVLEEVCKFIKESNLREKGIEFVEVNLSVVQCMQKRIFYDILDVLRKYDIPPEMINLEITESAAAYSEKRLIQNMARLSLMNIAFSLDDYGSGYSNINYLVKLPFYIAKIDKYVVWAANKSVKSKMLLQNTIEMFKKINLKIVTEGIETREMADEVIEMGADYIQGYYFSKPVPREKLLECLEEGYLEKLI